MEKAFDRCELQCLLTFLNHMGFGPNFLCAISSLYHSLKAQASVNGFQSDDFNLTRSTHQGSFPFFLLSH